jgi:hypothetical protein
VTAQPKPKLIVGRFLNEQTAQELHAYLMSRPCDETFDLVCALRSAKPLTREPK